MRFHGFTETEYDVTSEFSTKFYWNYWIFTEPAHKNWKQPAGIWKNAGRCEVTWYKLTNQILDWRQTYAGPLSDSGGVIWGRSDQPGQLTL